MGRWGGGGGGVLRICLGLMEAVCEGWELLQASPHKSRPVYSEEWRDTEGKEGYAGKKVSHVFQMVYLLAVRRFIIFIFNFLIVVNHEDMRFNGIVQLSPCTINIEQVISTLYVVLVSLWNSVVHCYRVYCEEPHLIFFLDHNFQLVHIWFFKFWK